MLRNLGKKQFVTYKGGNSHKHDRFYADRHVNKPVPVVHHNTPTTHGNKPVAHNNDRAAMPLGSSKNKTLRNNGHSNAKMFFPQSQLNVLAIHTRSPTPPSIF